MRQLTTVKIGWDKDATGGCGPVEVPGSEETRPRSWSCWPWASWGRSTAGRDLGLQIDARTNVEAEYGKFATSVAGVFAAGDCRRGQSLVVWAINEGRGAARECDRYLMGTTDLP